MRDAGEPGVAVVTIVAQPGNLKTVTMADDPNTQEDETGRYWFTELAAGTYTITEEVPSGHIQTYPPGGSYSVTLGKIDMVTGRDFGNTPCNASPLPIITSAVPDCRSNKVCLTFNQSLGQSSQCSIGPANFSITPKLGISSVQFDPNNQSACLLLSQPLVPGITYTVSGVNLCNRCGQTNQTVTQTTFICPDNQCISIVCPTNLIVACNSPRGTPVEFNVIATNRCGAQMTVECSPSSGSSFPVGTTTVFCQAFDSVGNSSGCSFTVSVIDTTPPMILCPTNIVTSCTSTNGAVVNFTVPATDNCDVSVSVVCTPPSGSQFPIGETEVSCQATDSSGNSACCSFTVRVEAPAPSLKIQRVGSMVAIDVPGTCSTLTLETATDLGPSAKWVSLPLPAGQGEKRLILPATEPMQFFRLRGSELSGRLDLIHDDNFAQGEQGWSTAYGTPLFFAAQGFRDRGYIELTGSKNTGSAIQKTLNPDNKILENRSYLLSFYARFVPTARQPEATFVKLRAVAFNETLAATNAHPRVGSVLALIGVSGPIASTNWTLVKLPVWRANKTFDKIALSAESSSGALAPAHMDNISLAEVSGPNPCNPLDAAPLDASGKVIFPAPGGIPSSTITISDIIYEDVDMLLGNVKDLYSNQYNIDGTAMCYPTNNPGWSIGGLLPTNITFSLNQALIENDVANSPIAFVEVLATTASNALANITGLPAYETLGPIPGHTPVCNFIKDSNSPFEGRDIIFVHGFRTVPLFAWLKPWHCNYESSKTRWPEDSAEFYTGYWKKGAESYWRDHINHFLQGKDYKNRSLIVAHAVTQTFDYGAHAVLSQISEAMRHGTGVQLLDPNDPRGTANFGQCNYVIVSHSAGALMSDIILSLANRTKTDTTLASRLGNLGYIADGCKAHIALQGAFSGSHVATLALAAVDNCGVSALWAEWTGVKTLFQGDFNAIPAAEIRLIARNSQLRDMCPLVAQQYWGPWVNTVPVPVLTVIGGHASNAGVDNAHPFPHPLTLAMKNLVHAGFDDGVLTIDSQAGNTNSVFNWPSGFVPIPAPGNQNLIDRGISNQRWLGFYMDQVVDPITYGGPSRAASGAVPFLSPSGMVQPVATFPAKNMPYSPINRYANHYSFLQTASDHYWGPVGAQGDTNAQGMACSHYGGPNYQPTKFIRNDFDPCDPDANTDNACDAHEIVDDTNSEETSVITDASVYNTYGTDNTPLVSPGMKFLTEEYVRGKTVTFTINSAGNSQTVTCWIWKRTYHLLLDYQTMTECGYVYRYALKP